MAKPSKAVQVVRAAEGAVEMVCVKILSPVLHNGVQRLVDEYHELEAEAVKELVKLKAVVIELPPPAEPPVQ